MALIGYARVSTGEQTLDSQLRELERNGATRVFSDVGISGAVPAHQRPGFAEMLGFVRDGDVVIAYRLDRVSRSASDALNLVERLDAMGVELRTIADGLSSRGTTGRLVLQILAAVAEMERSVIRERVQAGVDARRAKGLPTGRPRALTGEARDAVRALRGQGKSIREISRALGVSSSTVHRALDS